METLRASRSSDSNHPVGNDRMQLRVGKIGPILEVVDRRHGLAGLQVSLGDANIAQCRLVLSPPSWDQEVCHKNKPMSVLGSSFLHSEAAGYEQTLPTCT